MQVVGSGRNVAVAQQFGNRCDVGALAQQRGSEVVPQRMHAEVFISQAAAPQKFLEQPVKGGRRSALARGVADQRRLVTVRQIGDVLFQQLAKTGVEGYVTLAAAFAADADATEVSGDVGEVDGQQFRASQPATAEQCNDEPLLRGLACREQAVSLFAGEDAWQLALPLGAGQVVHRIGVDDPTTAEVSE